MIYTKNQNWDILKEYTEKMYKNEKLLDSKELRYYINADLMDHLTAYGDQLESGYKLPELIRTCLDKVVMSIDQNTPKCSIKLQNGLLDYLFEFIRLEKSHGPFWAWQAWKTGYNISLLPYLDLSEYDFNAKVLNQCPLNLSGHSEIVTPAVARKKGLDKALFDLKYGYKLNLNGVDLSESNGIFKACDLRNTGIGKRLGNSNGILHTCINNLSFCNLEGEDLSDKYYLLRSEGANFKNTGLKVDLRYHLTLVRHYQSDRMSNLVKDCNFVGCKIAEIEKCDTAALYRDTTFGFPGTFIEYNGKVYHGTEQIIDLFSHLCVDSVPANNTTKQKVKKL